MPRSLFIPTIGDVLVLAEDWSFPLHREYRNLKFGKDNFSGLHEWGRGRWNAPEDPDIFETVTLPAGAHLRIGRIYIRAGGSQMKGFDSVTFYCNMHLKGKPVGGSPKGAIRGRFWAKLPDVNRIVFE